MKIVPGLLRYFAEVRFELSKVTWPKKNDVLKLTLLVFVFSGLVGLYVGGLDFAFTKLLEAVVSR